MPVFNNALAGAAGSGGADGYKIERSLKFNLADSPYLHRQNSSSTSSSARKFTLSFWAKRVDSASNRHVFFAGSSLNSWNTWTTLFFMGSGQLQFEPSILAGRVTTVAKYQDYSAWSHFVLSVDSELGTPADRIKIFHNGVRQDVTYQYAANQNQTFAYGAASYYQQIGFNSNSYGMNGYLADMHFVDDQALDPTSFGEYNNDTGAWDPKEYSGSHGTNGWYLNFSDNSSVTALGNDSAGSNNFTPNSLSVGFTPGKLYKSSTLYTTKSDITSNGTLISNGESVTNEYLYLLPSHDEPNGASVFDANGFESSTGTIDFYHHNGLNWLHVNGSYNDHEAVDFNWGASHSNYYTLQADRDFYVIGSNLGGSVPVAFTGYVPAVSSGGVGIDSVIDSPTNYEADSGNNGGNYAALNPLVYGSNVTYSQGNLTQYCTTSSWNNTTRATATIGVSSGKWYWEQKHSTHQYAYTGIVSADDLSTSFPGASESGCGYQTSNGAGYPGSGGNIQTSGGYPHGAIEADDIIMFALDLDNQKMWIGRNGIWLNAYDNGQQGNPATGANSHFTNIVSGRTYLPSASTYATVTIDWNYGSRAFAYEPPTGFKAICTQNITDPLVVDSSTVFDAKTYDGNGGTKVINSYNFSPDLAWFKRRDTSGQHVLVDTLRTRTKGSYLNSQTNQAGPAEFTSDANKDVASFDSNGFTLGPNNQTGVNENNAELVAWAWDAGDAANATSVSAGSLNSSSYSYGTYSGKWNATNSPSSTGSVADGERAFNGNLGNYASMQNSNSFSKWQPNSPVQVNSSLRVLASGINSGNNQVAVNGTYFYVTNKPVWYTISASYLTEIRLQDTGSTHGRLWAVEVDGKLLIDNNITPPNVPSIATSYRANSAAGFSIVSYQGDGNTASVATGLSGDPGMIFIKDRDATTDWPVYHAGFDDPANNVNILNNTSQVQSISGYWTGTRANIIGLKSGTWAHNTNTKNYIAYCWSTVEGYSKFSEYRGDGQNNNGPFVYTGFRPRWILIRSTAGGQDWLLFDTTRDPDNDSSILKITPNETNGEVPHSNWIEILSNGFKLKTNAASINENGTKYIYSAFAENPLKYARAR